MDNIIHSSETGFIVGKSPNVNAVYGPWESLEQANTYLEQNFVTWDSNFNEVVDIPAGTTVAIYNDSSKRTVTEYWWSDNQLVLKTYGNNYFELIIEDEFGQRVTNIHLGENGINTPMYLYPKRIDNSLSSVIDSGYIQYCLSPEVWSVYIDNPQGIQTRSISEMCIIEWRDDNDKIVTSVNIPVNQLPQVTQTFYAYNNNVNTPPSYLSGVGQSYQHTDWTPNEYNKNDWSLLRRGVSDEYTIEWAISRTRTCSVWGDLSSPIISSRWGQDGISTDTKQILYTYTYNLIQTPEYFETSRRQLDTDVPTGTQSSLDDSYTFFNITWYKSFKDVSLENRYCYVTERSLISNNVEKVYGNWTYPALYANFAADGKDGDTIEYIYCKSKTETLSDEAKNEFNSINEAYTTDESKNILGGPIQFHEYNYWTNDPLGVTDTDQYEFCSIRTISYDDLGNAIYHKFVDPFIWAAFGKEGPDGPGLEYIYILSKSENEKPITNESFIDINNKSRNDDEYLPRNGESEDSPSWSDNPLTVSSEYSILWMSQRKGTYGSWESFTQPVIWNKFSQSYELKLSNDNCSIPSSSDGTYLPSVSKLATQTKVELYLGKDKVENCTIQAPTGYSVENNIYYLNEFIPIDSSYHAEFKAFVDDEEVASKVQSLTLNRGKESYSLFCQPNSRIWYGGNEYSNTQFNINVYHLSEDGKYTEVEDLSTFKLYYQLGQIAEPRELIGFEDNLVEIKEGLQNDIILTLRNEDGIILDSEVIDAVDYSKIKGKDNDGVTFVYQENINIPENQKDNIQYIQKATETSIKAYRGVKDVVIESITAEAYNLINPSEEVNITNNENKFFINQTISSDVQILYTVYISVDGESTEYYLAQRINLTKDAVVYELHPSIGYLICNQRSGLNIDAINFNVVSSNDSELPDYKVTCQYGDEQEITLNTNVNTFDFDENILNYLKAQKSTTYLTFRLIIDGKIRDVETIPVSPEPEVEGHAYSIDLSNPYVQLPLGLDSSVISSWTENVIKVYQGSQEIFIQNEYPNFTITSESDLVSITGSTTKLINQPNDSKLIHFTITINEDENTQYTFTKSQQIQLINSTVYSLSSNPTSVVTSPKINGNFVYTPIIHKLSLGQIETVSDLEKEGLYYIVEGNNEQLTTPTTIQYLSSDETIHVSLYKDDYLYDYDTIAIVRNGEKGADGLSTKYVYGRIKEGNGTIIKAEDLENDLITEQTANSFNKTLESDLLNWSEDPLGISDNFPQEFIAQSIKTDEGWSKFSKPVVHAQFGQKGEDGNGVEYLYTVCQSLPANSKESGGFTITDSVYNSLGELIEGCTELNSTDDYKIPGWFDNIPDLQKDFPNLYMTMRRKSNGKWGHYSLPVLWNQYNSKLDLFINNDTIILDDNSDADTIQSLTTTHVSVSYCGTSIQNPEIKTSISQELEGLIEVVQNNSGEFYLKLKDNITLYQTSGQVTYSYQHSNSESITKKQSIYIKDFSVGEGYKLILEPNVISSKFENNEYSWENISIKASLTKIKGSDSSNVEIPTSEFKLYIDDNECETNVYEIQEGRSATVKPIIFSVKKNGVLVDSQSVSFSTKGADGKSASFRMRGAWDSTVRYLYQEVDSEGGNVLYTDIVSYKSGDSLKFYQSKKINNLNQKPTKATEYWEEVAQSEVTLTQQLLIYNDDKLNISGGFVDVESSVDKTNKGVILWAGGSGSTEEESANTATFKVTRDGTLYAKEGLFQGTYLSKDKDLSKFKLRSYIDPTYIKYIQVSTDDNGETFWDEDGYLYEGLSIEKGVTQIVAVMPPIVDFNEMSEIMVFPNKDYNLDESTILVEGVLFPRYTPYFDISGEDILNNDNIKELIIQQYNASENYDQELGFGINRTPLVDTNGQNITNLTKTNINTINVNGKKALAEKLCNTRDVYYRGSSVGVPVLFPGIIYQLTEIPLFIRGKKPLVELPTGIIFQDNPDTLVQDSSLESVKTQITMVTNNIYTPCLNRSEFEVTLDKFYQDGSSDLYAMGGVTDESYYPVMFNTGVEEDGINWTHIDVNPSIAYYYYMYTKNVEHNSVISIDLQLDRGVQYGAQFESKKLQDLKYKMSKVYKFKNISIFGNVDVSGINYALTKENQFGSIKKSSEDDLHFDISNISYTLLKNSLLNTDYTHMQFKCEQVPLFEKQPLNLTNDNYYILYGYIHRYAIPSLDDNGYIYKVDNSNDYYWYSKFRTPSWDDSDMFEYQQYLTLLNAGYIGISHKDYKANTFIDSDNNILNKSDQYCEFDNYTVYFENSTYSTQYASGIKSLTEYSQYGFELCWFTSKLEDYASDAIECNAYKLDCLFIAYINKTNFDKEPFYIYKKSSQEPYGYYLGCKITGLEKSVVNTLEPKVDSKINITFNIL